MAKFIEDRGRGTLSISTLRRAENGTATRATVALIASALGFPSTRYLVDTNISDTTQIIVDVSGKWFAYYLEADDEDNPIVASEELFVRQDGFEISGVYRQISGFRTDAADDAYSFEMKGYICGNILVGLYYVGLPSPEGTGSFQLKLVSTMRAEGICSFTDGEKDSDVWFSRCIWLHSKSENLARERKLARSAVLVPPQSVGSSKKQA